MSDNLGRMKRILGADEYYLSDLGKLYKVIDGKLIEIYPSYQSEYPYWLISYQGNFRAYSCHRLMAEYFLPNPQGYKVVNHKDGNKHNFKLSNLEWCSQGYNVTHGYRTGLNRHTTPKVIVDAIIAELSSYNLNAMKKYPYKQIAAKYNVSYQTVWNIAHKVRHAQSLTFTW